MGAATGFSGIWPAMVTPLGPDELPDLQKTAAIADALLSEGCDGLYLLGATGQGPVLPEPARRSVAEVVLATVQQRAPVIVHVGAVTTAESVRLAVHAASHGATGISAVGPVFYPQTVDMVFEHYQRIAGATELPFFPYLYLRGGQMHIDADTFSQQAARMPTVRGMKYTSRDLFELGRIHHACGESFCIFSGSDELFCQAALSGATGAIGTYFNLFPDVSRRIRAQFVAGDFEGAKRYMSVFARMIARTGSDKWGFLRAGMRIKFHIDIGMPAPPLGNSETEWDDAEVASLIREVESVGREVLRASQPGATAN